MIIKKGIRSFLNLTLAAVFLLSACSFGSQTEDSISGSQGSVTIPDSSKTAELECEIIGYPCTYDEVDPRILEESFTDLSESEQAAGGDPGNRAQDITNQMLGKMLRLDIDGDDRDEAPGGLLRSGIPGFRLPRAALQRDVDRILGLEGLEFVGGTTVGRDVTLEDLRAALVRELP